MDTLGKNATAVQRAGAPAGTTRPLGQSGEGARSAMEQLIQQQRKLDAQRPGEVGAAAAGKVPAS